MQLIKSLKGITGEIGLYVCDSNWVFKPILTGINHGQYVAASVCLDVPVRGLLPVTLDPVLQNTESQQIGRTMLFYADLPAPLPTYAKAWSYAILFNVLC